MKLSCSITNIGQENKVYNIFSGGNPVEEVEDNIEVSQPYISDNIDLGVSLLQGVYYSEIYNGRYYTLGAGSVFGQQRIIVTDLIDKSFYGSLDLVGYEGTIGDPELYFSNGKMYAISHHQFTRIIAIIDPESLVILSTVSVPLSAGLSLTGGTLDKESNRLYITTMSNSVYYLDTVNDTLSAGIPLGISTSNCSIGSSTILFSGYPSSGIVIIDKGSFSVVDSYTGTDLFGQSRFLNGKYVVKIGTIGSYIFFINESDFSKNQVFINTSPWGMSKIPRDNRYFYSTGNPSGNVVEIDMQNESAREICSLGFSNQGFIEYNPAYDVINVSSLTNFYSVNPETGSFYTMPIPLGQFLTGYPASLAISSSGLIYICTTGQSGAMDDTVYEISQLITPVNVIYNGGANTSQYINTSLVSNPIKILRLRIVASDIEALKQIITKFRIESTGSLSSSQFRNLSKYDADTLQFIAEYDSSEIFPDAILNGQSYIQGTIPGGSNIVFELDYVEYDPSLIVDDDCYQENPEELPKIVQIFINRRFF